MREPKDFTRRRKGGNIVLCQQCGRKGWLRQYRDGSAEVIHRIEYRGIMPIVADHCTLERVH